MRFWKMQGAGNDFVVLNCMDAPAPEMPETLARRLCDRHFGIGADGLLLALPSRCADMRMRILNSDGSEPEMCGNGIRCIAKFAYDMGYLRKDFISIETLGGIKALQLQIQNGSAAGATVDMGEPILAPAEIPVNSATNQVSVTLDGREIRFFCVSMGNPHAVTYDLFPEADDFLRFGQQMENHPLFPQKTNVEFCRTRNDHQVDVRVWERGCGATMACGTGASAALVAGVHLGKTARRAELALPGGTLHMRWADNGHVFMTGGAEMVFDGEISL